MKTLKLILLVLLVTVVGILTLTLRSRSLQPVSANPNQRHPRSEAEAIVEQASNIAAFKPAVTVLFSRSGSLMQAHDVLPKATDVVRIPADRALVTVNQRSLFLKDLVPLRTDEQERNMTEEELQSRLSRAIEMEITFQAAAAQGVELTPEQKNRVGAIAQKHEAAFRDYQEQGVTWSSVATAQVQFEQRLTSALLLQQNLVAREAGVAPSSDRNVQARYEQVRSELLSRIKATSSISVSSVEL